MSEASSVFRNATERAAVAILAVLFLLPTASSAGPDVDLHELTWYVHVDLIDAGAGEDLAYWQGVIDASVARANALLEGAQGPFDTACCTRIERSANVTTFGTTGDGRDVIDSLADQNFINSHGGAGSSAYLVDSMTYCGGDSPNAIGCAETPTCNGNGNDDPTLWMVVTVESFDDDTLSAVIAHERGHNACLTHVANAECQIMQSTVYTPGLGGCLGPNECLNYQAARTTTSSGLECGCQDGAGGLEPDGNVCSEIAGGVCSGGLCGAPDGDAGVRLVAAANPGTAALSQPEDALHMSALTGNWQMLAQITPSADDIRGLAYATDSQTLYGVIPTVGDDLIVVIDPDTGLQVGSAIGAIANGSEEITAMAYDPGASSAADDDRLLVLEVGTGLELRSIDPATPDTATLLGAVLVGPPELFTGLAYDSIQERLFASTPFGPDGLYEISNCPPSPCSAQQVAGAGLFREDGSLSYSPDSGMLYLVGTAFGGQRTFYNVIDPVSGTSVETLSLDVLTPAALAAVPEPTLGSALGAGILWLAAGLGVRRRRNSSRGA